MQPTSSLSPAILPSSVLPQWLARAFDGLRAGDIAAWMEIYAPDAVHAFPFAPPGAVRRLEGKPAIEAYLRPLPGLIRFGALSDVAVREAGAELIIEATGHHTRVADGAALELDYVWFIMRSGGQVVRLRDYMNPLQLAAL